MVSTQEIGRLGGLVWYQKTFESCEKIVIICTKESKEIQENNFGESMFYESILLCYVRIKKKDCLFYLKGRTS